MKNARLQGNVLLFITAFIWGAAFVAQKIGVIHLGAFTFTAVRFFISGIALLPVILLNGQRRKKTVESNALSASEKKAKRRFLMLGGMLCGLCLMSAASAQQIGIAYTTAGKAGFITALYILFVPFFRLFGGKKAAPIIWISVLTAAAGLYLLCVKQGFSVNTGDLIVLLSAALFAVHILVIDRFSPHVDGVKLACIQFFVTALVAAVPMFIFERPNMGEVLECWAPLLYLGIISGGIGYTLQILGQKNTDPAVASLIFSLESVFAAICGAIFLSERFTAKEFIGCVLVFIATLLSQIDIKEIINRIRRKEAADKKESKAN